MKDESTRGKGTTLRWVHPDDILFNSSRIPFRIEFGFESGGDPFAIDIRQIATCVLSSEAKIGLKAVLIFARNLTDLLTFVSQSQAWVTQAEYACPYPEDELKGGYEKLTLFHCDLARGSCDGKPRSSNMLFTLDRYIDRASDIWDNWCRIEADYRPVLHYDLADVTERPHYTFHRILNLSKAIEVFHWRKTKLKTRLKIRVQDLWELQSGHIRRLLGEGKAFAAACSHSRNYCTHYDREYSTDVGVEIEVAAKLRILLTSAFLQELGFSHDEIDEIATKGLGSRAFQIPTVVK